MISPRVPDQTSWPPVTAEDSAVAVESQFDHLIAIHNRHHLHIIDRILVAE